MLSHLHSRNWSLFRNSRETGGVSGDEILAVVLTEWRFRPSRSSVLLPLGLESTAMPSREAELLQERGISWIAVQVLQQAVVFDEDQTAVMLGVGVLQPLEHFISLVPGCKQLEFEASSSNVAPWKDDSSLLW